MTDQENPSIASKLDRVTGKPATIYTPPEDLVDPSNVPSSSGARVAAYAEAIRGAVALLSEETTAEDWLEEAHAVMAVADAEQAELRAEVERLRSALADNEQAYTKRVTAWGREKARAEAAEAEVERLRQGLWDTWAVLGHDTDGDTGPGAWIAGSGVDSFIESVVRDAATFRRESEDDYGAAEAERDEALTDADALAKVVRDAQAHTARRGGKSAAWEALTTILHQDSGGPIQRYEARARGRIVASLTPGYKESVVSPAEPERNYKAEVARLREALGRVEALADEWTAEADRLQEFADRHQGYYQGIVGARRTCRDDLRAVLADATPARGADQDRSGVTPGEPVGSRLPSRDGHSGAVKGAAPDPTPNTGEQRPTLAQRLGEVEHVSPEVAGLRALMRAELASGAVPSAGIADMARRFSLWLNGTYPPDLDTEALHWRRVSKVSEEAGEVREALGAWFGENPRKDRGTVDEVVKELADCVGAALGAIEHLTGHEGRSLDIATERVRFVCERVGVLTAATPTAEAGDTDE